MSQGGLLQTPPEWWEQGLWADGTTYWKCNQCKKQMTEDHEASNTHQKKLGWYWQERQRTRPPPLLALPQHQQQAPLPAVQPPPGFIGQEQLPSKVDRLESKVDALEAKVDNRVDALEAKMDLILAKLEELAGLVRNQAETDSPLAQQVLKLKGTGASSSSVEDA